MKQKFKILLFALLLVCGLSVKQKTLNPKIIFEDGGYKTSSVAGVHSEGLTEEQIVVQVLFDYDAFPELSAFSVDEEDVEQVDALRRDYKELAKEYYYSRNVALSNDLNITEYINMYISKYSAFVEYTFQNKFSIQRFEEKLEMLANVESVKNVYVKTYQAEHYKSNYLGALDRADAFEYRSYGTYTGSGVTVGVLDCGIIDKTHITLANTNYLIYDSFWVIEKATDHATQVAALIAGDGGIAPNAKILSAQITGSPNDEIEWMMDHNVDIVNMSFGEDGNFGRYSSVSAYMDFIAYQYRIHFVSSAGNRGNGDEYVTNPALGYNVLAVGATESDGFIAPYSSYKTDFGPNKPNVVVLGSSLTFPNIPGFMVGTSYSSAIASALIALYFEYNPLEKMYPERVIAAITANAVIERSSSYTINYLGYLNEYIGAGHFNLKNMINNSSKQITYYNTKKEVAATVGEFPVFLSAGQTLRLGLAWIARATGSVGGTYYLDYDMELYYKPGSSYIYKQGTGGVGNNVELMEHKATDTGMYWVRIKQYTPNPNEDQHRVSIAWSVK